MTATPWDVARNDTGANDDTRLLVRTTIATYGQVGSVWSTAYSGVHERAVRRGDLQAALRLGPAGLGAIYRFALLADGAVRANASAMPTIDVTTLRDQNGAPDRRRYGRARVPLGLSSSLATDTDAFAQSAKVGIGGISLNAAGTVLYFVNLRDRQLYAIDLTATPMTAQAHRHRPRCRRAALGADGARRQWCTSARPTRAPRPGSRPLTAGLRARVRAASEASVRAGAPAVDVGAALGGRRATASTSATQGQPDPELVGPWHVLGRHQAAGHAVEHLVRHVELRRRIGRLPGSGRGGGSGWGPVHAYPQAVLTDLTFDQDGFLILSLADRTAIQGGNRNDAADASVTGTFQSISAGDMLIAGAEQGAHACSRRSPTAR